MSYIPPPETRSRVENIKKKFEVVNNISAPPDGSTVANNPSKHSITNSSTPKTKVSRLPNKIVASPRRKALGEENGETVATKPTTSRQARLDRQLSAPAKGNIRRSPAFRCDKIVRGKNVVGPGKPASVVGNRVKLFEDGDKKIGQPGEKSPVTPLRTSTLTPTNKSEIQSRTTSCTSSAKKILNNNNNNGLSSLNLNIKKHDNLRKSESLPVDAQHNIEEISLNVSYASVMKVPKVSPPLPRNSDTPFRPERKKVKQYSKKSSNVDIHKTPSCSELAFDEDSVHTKVFVQNNVSSNIENASNEKILNSSVELSLDKSTEPAPTSSVAIHGLTDTLVKAALSAPLPTGPPPKKPPRTFAHVSPAPQKFSTQRNTSDRSPTGSSSDSSPPRVMSSSMPEDGNLCHVKSRTEPHIMLKKLENVLLSQQGAGGVILKPKSPMVKRSTKDKATGVGVDENVSLGAVSKLGVRTGPLPDVPSYQKVMNQLSNSSTGDSSALFGGCLNCVNPNASYGPIHFYEKLPEKQSEFFVDDLGRTSSLDESTTFSEAKRKLYGTLHKSRSEEHIYAEPFDFLSKNMNIDCDEKRKNGDSAGDLTKVAAEKIQKVLLSKCMKPNVGGLHYLCTAIDTATTNGNHTVIGDSKAIDQVHQDLTNAVHKIGEDQSVVQSNVEEKILNIPTPTSSHSRKAPLLRLAGLVKSGQGSDSTNKVDRHKIQLLMNQAFGSPLQGMPTEALNMPASDSDSPPLTPDDEGFVHIFKDDYATAIGVIKTSPDLSPTEPEDTGIELPRLTEERKVYVRRVSSRVFDQSTKPNSHRHLFECVLLVGLNLDTATRVKVPYIKMKYPTDAEVPASIEHLCFPDASDWSPPVSPTEHNGRAEDQSYSLVITDEMGHRKFGYCRRVCPEGASICIPLAYCIISPFKANGFYFKVLSELESMHGQPEWLQTAWVKELHACEFPNPGQVLKLPRSLSPGSAGGDSASAGNFTVLRRPPDIRLEERDLTQLFSSLQLSVLLQVFSSILLERKVLLVSVSLGKLSSCIGALDSILYPFSWQHTFIPVLPARPEFMEISHSPVPYIMGVLKNRDGKLPPVTVDEGMMVDLDDSSVLHSMGDEGSILPARLRRGLKAALQLVVTATLPHEPSRNVLVSEAFVRMFVEACGHYPTHIVRQQDGRRVFERESFIKAVQPRCCQLFLEWFTETAMFSSFIHSRLEEVSSMSTMFEQRAAEHSEEMAKNTMLFLRNYKVINKKVKTFGDRLKDWTPFT